MICRKPFVKNGTAYGCGQCLPCRINRRRIWTHRILLESLTHSTNCFLSLTYNDESLPLITGHTGDVIGTLKPTDLQLWLKRFRLIVSPLSVRYYAVGEYGDVSFRPHYHVAVFGYRGCMRGRTKRVLGTSKPDPDNCCDNCRLASKSWGMGLIEFGELNPQSASYLAAYTTKKMTRSDDPRLEGRYPEFARMSLKNGGIGSDAMWEVASSMFRYRLDDRSDVPYALNHGRVTMPLGRYLMGKLRQRVGKSEKAPDDTLQKMEEKMQPLRESAFDSSRSLREVVAEASEQVALNMEVKSNIFKKRNVL